MEHIERAARVFIYYRKGRARNALGYAEMPRYPLGEVGLAGAHFAGVEHSVTGFQ